MPDGTLDLSDVQSRYSPDNRLSFEQQVAMAARLKDRYGVSDMRALTMVHETQAARQAILDERVTKSGGKSWKALREEGTSPDLEWEMQAAPVAETNAQRESRRQRQDEYLRLRESNPTEAARTIPALGATGLTFASRPKVA